MPTERDSVQHAWQDRAMRLHSGVTVTRADEVLRDAENTWMNARGAQNYFYAYADAVHDTYPLLKQTFAAPDLAEAIRSAAYWSLLNLGGSESRFAFTTDPNLRDHRQLVVRAQNRALAAEIDNQVRTLERARGELEALKELAARPGLPVVYDTNMLNHWNRPTDIHWQNVLKVQGEDVGLVRLVVPLRVVDELDGQTYGSGQLAQRATAAIRYLEKVLADRKPGEAVTIREEVSLEVWIDNEHRGGDSDLAILRCAADLDALRPQTGARVLTNDYGMRLRAQQLGLTAVRLPAAHRKQSGPTGDAPEDEA